MHHPIASALGAPSVVEGEILIRTPAGEAGYPLYGPYIDLPPGSYTAGFQIRVTPADAAASKGGTLGRVEATAEGGTRFLATRDFDAGDLRKDDGRLDLDFTVDVPSNCEFRVFATGAAPLTVHENRRLTAPRDLLDAENGDASSPDGRFAYSGFFLKYSGALAEYRRRGARLRPAEDGVLMNFAGVELLVQNPEDFQLINEILIGNLYHFNLREPTCVVDVGMNIGLASLYFARQEHVRRVVSFEPFAAPYERARRNFALNPSLAGKITPRNEGLSDRNEERSLGYDANHTIGASIRGGGTSRVTVRVRDAAEVIGEIVEEAEASGLRTVVKLDCEGSEFPIMERLEAAGLLPRISAFLMEWHKWWSPEKTAADLIRPLLAADYLVMDRTQELNPHAGEIFAVRTRR